MSKNIDFNELVGKTLTKVEISPDRDEANFYCNDGTRYKMYHTQGVCETVVINDISGNIEDLLESPILNAIKRVDVRKQIVDEYNNFLLIFFKLVTAKGQVVIRWYSEADGYSPYDVDFVMVN